MTPSDKPVLVIGATGFLGRRVVAALRAEGHAVRCMVRNPDAAKDLAGESVEVVRGDMLDADAVTRAAASVRAVIVCVHTLSRQTNAAREADFMDVEETGLRAIVAACREQGVSRVLYVTSIGVASDAVSPWLRGRHRTEQLLLGSGLDATVLRPGMIVGHGGDGFSMVERGARGRVAVLLASRAQRFRTIAVTDLARHLVDLIDEPRSFGQAFDVGSDDVFTMDQMIDVAADHLGRAHPAKVHLPRGVIKRLSPLIERAARMPRGALSGLVGDGSDADMIGDATPVRALLTHQARPFQDAMAEALS
jgi:uncharacterized protein YbjT (DUF2867 family)